VRNYFYDGCRLKVQYGRCCSLLIRVNQSFASRVVVGSTLKQGRSLKK